MLASCKMYLLEDIDKGKIKKRSTGRKEGKEKRKEEWRKGAIRKG